MQNKKHGMLVLLAVIAVYIAAVVGLVLSIINNLEPLIGVAIAVLALAWLRARLFGI